MAGLKDVNASEIFKRIKEAEEQGHDRLRRTAEEAIADIKTAMSVRQDLPHRTSDLLVDALVAQVAELDFRDEQSIFGVHVNTNRGQHTLPVDKQFPAGKYRVLLFILPIKE